MAHQKNTYQTNGSNALKVDALEFDVFVKPQFSDQSEEAPIIEFPRANRNSRSLTRTTLNSRRNRATRSHSKSLWNVFSAFVRNNKVLKGLFEHKKGNTYRKDDIITFAKGFTATGIAAFVLIVFGV